MSNAVPAESWKDRDLKLRGAPQILKTVELKGPKGDVVVVNETDQAPWVGRGYKPSGRSSPQNEVGPSSVGATALAES
ncbi:MAG TPA: hypothetical protein VFD43_12145 [Planctomycetota bacterium]|nr:hypothetical protein [Planctomycetota bacterium]